MNKSHLKAAMSELAKRRWKKFTKKHGRKALRKRMSEIGKLGGRPRKVDKAA